MMLLIILLSFVSAFLFCYGSIEIVRMLIKRKGRSVYEQVDKSSPVRQAGMPFIKLLASYNKELNLKGYEKKLLQKLNAAGRPGDFTPTEFLSVKQLAALSFLVLSFLFFKLAGVTSFSFPVLLGALAFFLPDFWLGARIKARHTEILKMLPYNLDLLTLSVEAGMDFASAVGKVVETGRAGPLMEELYQMLREIQMGKTRREALRDMATRINLQEMTSFTMALIQADQLGTSLGPVLRIQADQLNAKREQRGEKKAMEAPVKMLFPLILFIFPTIFIMIFVPIIIKLMGGGIF